MMRHRENTAIIAASPQDVFAFVDDHTRFSAHMSASSWMMAGGRMTVEPDAGRGQVVGSHIRLSGTVWGLRLFLDEVVTRRTPPTDKVWETVGTPRLVVIGTYRMGIEVAPTTRGARLRVFIDYDLPASWTGYCLGLLFSGIYARWCVAQMLDGTSHHFAIGAAA